MAVAACLMAAMAAPPEAAFEKVPAPALATLRIAKGKMIPAGLVFCNGKLLPGPYIVSRYGTAIRVNRDQVTGQIVPWIQFTTAAPKPAAKPPAAKPAAAPPPPPSQTAASQSVDDLFDDGPSTAKRPEPAKPQATPEPEPAGDYVDGPRSKALLKRINDYRTEVDRTLRGNGVYFFSARHAPVRVEPRLAKDLLAVLPDALRDATSAQQLHDMLRHKGVTYLPMAVCAELMKDRALYMKVRDRIREIKEEQKFRDLLNGAGNGR